MDANGSPPERRVTSKEEPRIARLLGAMGGLALFYVLTCGPSYKLFVHGGADQYQWFQFYTPLGYVAHACPPVRKSLNWYMALWNRSEDWYYSVW
jgi:hypothetical protein